MTDNGRQEKAQERYQRAAHRVQTAIAAMPGHPNQQTKHLRVGIDMSKADMAGLVELLIAKGVFTTEEYFEALATSAEREADAYAGELSDHLGVKVTTV